jgi:hypothetical protein
MAADPPAWPVRFNVSMPLGDTWGRENVHGFTWGFRGALLVYPTADGRGVGAGGYADALIDGRTRSMYSVGAIMTAPVVSWEIADLRLGGAVGERFVGDAQVERRLATALLAELVIPAYVYDFRLGVRADGTFDSQGMSARSLLVEVDIAVLLAAIGWAASGK